MQVVHSLVDVFIQILSGGFVLIMRMINIYFIVGASASQIIFNIRTVIPMNMLIMSNSKAIIG